MELKDQLHRVISLETVPKRIISLVPSQTELLCDLGMEDALVGITKFCIHPKELRKKVTVVGGTKQIHLDKIKTLNPDIILCNKEENTKEIVEACEGVCLVHVSDIYNLEDSLNLIAQYGALFNCKLKAEKIVETIKAEFNEFQDFVKDKPVVSVAYFIWKSPWMAAANHTFINYILNINKFENVFGHLERYPEIEPNKLDTVVAPEFVLLSSEPFPFKEIHKNEAQEIFPKSKAILVDGEMFSWYGSRLMAAFKYFKTLRLNLHTQL
ncbi:ABC transporter substrate-binding protein [Tamlana sp. s12]|uniref:ABC transporter substrate-binding protein n=1 Tax=Tamlana sp. s12 TaxID=1630406 RepID=UPI0007FC1C33|nr:helical backbone metal receptor [Tamlana sp. s12]OBQ56453.1 iron ABC transporter [Tamlana sp. s12]QQY81923.1 ABC transporter substrate-binding protein [Tamlana sp. s12]